MLDGRWSDGLDDADGQLLPDVKSVEFLVVLDGSGADINSCRSQGFLASIEWIWSTSVICKIPYPRDLKYKA